MKNLFGKKLKEKEIMTICRQISNMSASGCDFITIFSVLINASTVNMSKVLSLVKKNIEKGRNLTQSFAMTNSFSNFFLSMVYAGEVSGNIDFVFNEMSNYYDRECKLKSKLIGALTYPLLVVIVSIVAFNFIMIFVVPNFKMAFNMDNDNLPAYTLIVFKISEFLRRNLIILVILTTLIVISLYSLLKDNTKFKENIDERILKLPVVGKIYTLILTDKFSRTMSILMKSGVNIGEAIDISTRVIDNVYVSSKMKFAKQSIESGSNISVSLKKTSLFPELFISMIFSGEISGKFDESLYLAGVYYSNELDIKLEQYIKLIEPIMIVIVGILVGLTMVAILSPMFDMISSIS